MNGSTLYVIVYVYIDWAAGLIPVHTATSIWTYIDDVKSPKVYTFINLLNMDTRLSYLEFLYKIRVANLDWPEGQTFPKPPNSKDVFERLDFYNALFEIYKQQWGDVSDSDPLAVAFINKRLGNAALHDKLLSLKGGRMETIWSTGASRIVVKYSFVYQDSEGKIQIVFFKKEDHQLTLNSKVCYWHSLDEARRIEAREHKIFLTIEGYPDTFR
jgi:hypothetical protein